jgi:ABC-type nitrate/sulfonate/bicarbonate transport system substrate-binding protein
MGGVQAADSITLGLVAKLALQWPVYVAVEKGYFDRAGINLDLVTTGGSAKAAQQLAAGAINIGEAGLPDLLRPIDQGAPMKIIAYEVAEPPYKLMARKGVKSLAELKGKKIMIGGSKDITLIYLEAMAKPAGLKAGDFDLLYAGATSARFAALVSGGVEATILTSPFDFQAIGQGYANLGSVHTALPGFPFTGYGVHTPWANANRNAVVGFLRAVHQGVDWLYDPKNRDEAVNILVKHTGARPDDSVKSYDLFMVELKAFRRDGAIPPESFRRVLDAVAELGDLPKPPPPASKFLDDSFLKAALAGR